MSIETAYSDADTRGNLREFARLPHPFTFPGGYTMIGMLSDGETICHACVRSEYREIYRATRNADRSGWAFVGTFIHWEGEPELCCHCGAELESEYGPIEGGK
jgi:hypothetical protein